jgi:hypothetical protein
MSDANFGAGGGRRKIAFCRFDRVRVTECNVRTDSGIARTVLCDVKPDQHGRYLVLVRYHGTRYPYLALVVRYRTSTAVPILVPQRGTRYIF